MLTGFIVLSHSEAAGCCTSYVDLEIWLMALYKTWCQLLIGFWTARCISNSFRRPPHSVIHLARSTSALLSVTSCLLLRAVVFAALAAATSYAQTNWTKSHLNPVLRVGAPGSWDFSQAFFQTVLKRDSQYIMWYSGDDSTKFRTGRATSTDGVTWLKDSLNPILNAGSTLSDWNYWGSWVPRVIWDGTQYLMWFMGAGGSTRFGQGMKWQWGVARSVDGMSWLADSTNPINTDNLLSWWTDAAGPGRILFDGTTYRTWYEGDRGLFPGTYEAIGYATSPDGVHWAKYQPDPVLEPGLPGEWDESGIGYFNTVLYDAGIYQMWYTGNVIHDVTGTTGIGFAVSRDGIHWRKYPGNPVLTGGRPGSWDEHVYSPSVVFDGSVYRMWYSGSDPFYSQIGYATAPRSPAAILLSDSSIDFQNVQPGADSDTLSVSVSNWGFTPLTISALSHQKTEFILPGLPPLPLTIPPFDQILLALVFRPDRAGITVDDTLVLTSNDSLHPRSTLALRGRGSGSIAPAMGGQLYGISASQSETRLYCLDRKTGAAQPLAPFSPHPPRKIDGFAIRPSENIMYAARSESLGTVLYRVSPAFGDLEEAGSISIGGVTAMAFSRADILYVADDRGRLYRTNGIGPDTSFIGSTGIVFTGLAFSPASGVLWGCAHDSLYTIDSNSGRVVLIGSSGGALPSSIAFGPLGTLYGRLGAALVILDHMSGLPTLIGTMDMPNVNGIVMRTDIATETEQPGGAAPNVFQLSQNFPNPFNPATVVRYQLPAAANVHLAVYDLLGHEVAVLLDRNEESGTHEVVFDAARLASGTYFYRIRAGGFLQTKKMILAK